MNPTPDFVAIGLAFAAGLAIFLSGANLLSESLRAAAGEGMKRAIGRLTTNRLAGILTGAVATAALDSSSAVAIIAVGLVHARAMTFPQALGVVMGANIGTTVSSQIYALDAVKYGPVLLLPGLLLHWLGRSEAQRRWGGAVFGLGLVFFALTHLEEAARPLRDYGPFRALMLRMADPLWGVLAGAAVTAVIQSSSAMMGILIALAGQGAVRLDAAVAMMLGAEIGTCPDVLVASAGRSREAVRVGVFQLGFNVACVALAVGLVGPLTRAAAWLAGADVKRQLATAHVLFNVGGVLASVWFTRTIAGAVERLIPDRAGGPSAGDAETGPAGSPAEPSSAAADPTRREPGVASGGSPPRSARSRDGLPADWHAFLFIKMM
jgi:phosphate:Na+ symporter